MKNLTEKLSTILLVLCVFLLIGNMTLSFRKKKEMKSPAVAVSPAVPADPRRTPLVCAIEKVLPSVVNLSSRKLYRVHDSFSLFFGGDEVISRNSLGSGIILDKTGLVLTNAHVVHGAVDISATLSDGTVRKARLIAEDLENDISLLKMESSGRTLCPVDMGTPGDLMLGETTAAVGNPYGLDGTVTTGVISGTDRTLTRNGKVLFSDLIQTDTPVFPGSSGGPLVNIRGQMIGMNTGVRDAGIAFAMPLLRIENALAPFLIPERMTGTDLGFVPVMDKNGIIRIKTVFENSASAGAGLRKGDELLAFNGWEPKGNLLELSLRMSRVLGYEKTVLRTARRTFCFQTGKMDLKNGILLAKQRLNLGLSENLAKEKDRWNGLVVTDPPPESRLKRGDLLLAVGGEPVRNSADAARLLAHCSGGTLAVTVLTLDLSGDVVRRTEHLKVR